MSWRADRAGFDRRFPLVDNAIGNFVDHLLEQHAQMGVRPVIGGRNVFDAISVSRQLLAFSKSGALRIVRIVNRDGLPAVFLHDSETACSSDSAFDRNRKRSRWCSGEWTLAN